MASFQHSAGVLSEEWTSSPGAGGQPLWTCAGVCVSTLACIQYLSLYAAYRVRFVPLPHLRRLEAISLDGIPIVVGTIDVRQGPIWSGNTAPVRLVANCVKLGPVNFRSYAPKQDEGTYAGYELLQYTVAFQNLW